MHGRLQDLLDRAAEGIEVLRALRGEVLALRSVIQKALFHHADLLRHLRVVIHRAGQKGQPSRLLILHLLLGKTDTVFSDLCGIALRFLSQYAHLIGPLRCVLVDHIQIGVKIFLHHIREHDRCGPDLVQRESGVAKEQRVEDRKRIGLLLFFRRVERKDHLNKFHQKSAERQEYGAAKQVDRGVERRDPDGAGLRFEERKAHRTVYQIEYRQEQ